MVVANLLITITNKGTKSKACVDDIAILVVGKFTEMVVDIINQKLQEVNASCIKEGLPKLLLNHHPTYCKDEKSSSFKWTKHGWCPSRHLRNSLLSGCTLGLRLT